MRTLAAIGLPVLWSSLILPRLRLGLRGRTVANVVFATSYAAVFRTSRTGGHRGDLDTCAPRSSTRGLYWGAAVSVPVFAGYGVLLAVPSTRSRLAEFATRAPDVGLTEWITIHIPLGTVYTEELIFRATLDPLLNRSVGRLGTWLGAATFGLWHITPARAAGDSTPATVAATALGGLILSWLRRRTGSTLAPALLHLALNAGGAITPHLAGHLVGANRFS